jgi:hypothetical protein
LPLRQTQELHLAARCVPVEGIGQPRPGKPPPSPVLPADPSSATADCAATGPPPASTTSPASSW